jgi:hypothetical protein
MPGSPLQLSIGEEGRHEPRQGTSLRPAGSAVAVVQGESVSDSGEDARAGAGDSCAIRGATRASRGRKTRRPSPRPCAARRRRWSSVSRRRCPFTCSLRTRCSSTRYSMTCCWWRLTHPASVTSSTCKGLRSAFIGRSYRAHARTGTGEASTEYSDITGVTARGGTGTSRSRRRSLAASRARASDGSPATRRGGTSSDTSFGGASSRASPSMTRASSAA